MRKFILILIVLLIAQFGIAQTNYLPGKIVVSSGDTISGFIDYRGWSNNPTEINFKKSLDGAVTTKNPKNIVEFRVKDELYKSEAVEVVLTTMELNNAADNSKIETKLDTVFLQTLYSGNKSLFYHKALGQEESFYIEHESGCELLRYKKYSTLVDGNRMFATNREYISQLVKYLKDCPDQIPKIRKAQYKVSSLFKLFEGYYSCSSDPIFFKRKAKKVRADFGVVGGASFTKLSFDTDFDEALHNSDFSPSIDPAFGIFIDFVFPRNQGKWSIYNELFINNYSTNATYFEDLSNNNSRTSKIKFKYSYFNLNNMVQLKYPVGSLFIFVNAGVSNGFSFSKTNSKTIETIFFADPTIEGRAAVPFTRNYEQRIIASAGLNFKKLAVSLRMERGNGMSDINAIKSTTMRYYFLGAYRF